MNADLEVGHLSRRRFLAAITSAGAALLAVPAGALAASADGATEVASLAKYQGAIGSDFVLRLENGAVKARLEGVDVGAANDTIEQFTVKFEVIGAGDHALEQGSYTLEHRKLGQQQLFLVPGGDGSTMLTATFCHLV